MPNDPRPLRRVVPATAVVAAACATSLAPLAAAHPDDPKVRDLMPRYEGPGWVEASDAEAPSFPAENVVLRGWISLPDFPSNPASGNDSWGWTSPAGRDYALMGLDNGTAFVEVTDPGAPVIRDFVPGPTSLWRDVKTYQHYAYVVTEGVGGNLQVIDLSGLDAEGTVSLVNTISGPGTSRTHNVAIDEVSGFLYRSGGGSEGIRIYDLADPANPTWVATWSTRYVHDLQVVTYESGPYAGKQIAYLCSGFNGGFVDTGLTVLDVTDKSSLQVLDQAYWPSAAYSHQAWLNEDRTKLYLNDELDEQDFGLETTIHVFDVSDPANVVHEGAFTSGNDAVGHNLYVRGDRLFAANYRSGMRVYDLASDPLSPPEVAFFDTFPSDDAGFFNGAWNVYPFFESGTIIISDLERGLFVVELVEPRIAVAYPEGRPELVDPAGDTVRALVDELEPGALDGAEVLLVADPDGDAGPADPVAASMTSLGGGLFEGTLPSAECGDLVSWWIEVTFADGEQVSSPANAPAESWSAIAATGSVAVFADDAETNPGWTVTNVQVTGGAWERGVPAGDGDRGDPLSDFDGSGAAWLTENAPGDTDVDGGPTILTSPAIDLAGAEAVMLSYARWFTNDDGDDDELALEVSADGGATWVELESTGAIDGWERRTLRLDAAIPTTDDVRIRFLATDNPNDSVTEAGIDAVRIEVLECAPAGPPEDVDGDGSVGFGDLLAVLAAFGPCDGPPCPEDVDGDGAIGFDDVLAVLSAWG